MGPAKYDVVVDYGSGVTETIADVTMPTVIAIIQGYFWTRDRNNIKITIRPIGHKDSQTYRNPEE